MEAQSVVARVENECTIRKSPKSQELLERLLQEPQTLPEIFTKSCQKFFQRPFLGIRTAPKVSNPKGSSKTEPNTYEWQTYGQVHERVKNFGLGLRTRFQLSKGDKVGIMCKNKPEWVVSEFGCYFQSFVTVGLYYSLPPATLEYICNHSEISVLICDEDHVHSIILRREKFSSLKFIIQIENDQKAARTTYYDINLFAKEKNVQLFSFSEIEKEGQAFRNKLNNAKLQQQQQQQQQFMSAFPYQADFGAPPVAQMVYAPVEIAAYVPSQPAQFSLPKRSSRAFGLNGFTGAESSVGEIIQECEICKPHDPAALLYNNLKSGLPRGVLLSHLNLIATSASFVNQIRLTEQDIYFSFLPLSSVMEKLSIITMLRAGAAIGFSQSFKTYQSDVLLLKPTLITGIPKFFEKICLEVKKQIENSNVLYRWAFQKAYDYKCHLINTNQHKNPTTLNENGKATNGNGMPQNGANGLAGVSAVNSLNGQAKINGTNGVGAPQIIPNGYTQMNGNSSHQVAHLTSNNTVPQLFIPTSVPPGGLPVGDNQANNPYSSSVCNYLVFKQVKEQIFGPNLRLLLNGGECLNRQLYQFMYICFCVPIVQAYGLTETSGAGCVCNPDDINIEKVGPPLSCVEIKLINSHKYIKDGGDVGEICIRGPAVSSFGYYKDEGLTQQKFDMSGWFHTGDVGKWNKDGTLSILPQRAK